MSSNSNMHGPPLRAGRTFLIGGGVVAAGLTGFYLNMLRNKKKQEEAGTNPFHEQIIAHAGRKVDSNEELSALGHRHSDNPPAFRGDVHYNGHLTRSNIKNSPEYLEHGQAIMYMVPPPQRGHADGSGKAYTKSPDYTDNYGKTKRVPRKVAEVERAV